MATITEGMLGKLMGYRVIKTSVLSQRQQKKRHKNKLINWIFRNVYGYVDTPFRKYIIDHHHKTIVCHPSFYEELMKEVKEGS